MTTEKELVEHFGQPGNTTTTGDGCRHLVWTDARGQGHINMASMIIPFAGKPAEQTITNRSLSATIRDGIVVDYTVSDGSSKM